MGAGRWGNPLLLLTALALVLGRHQQWPGFQDSESPKNVNATLTFLLENYNNNSNDSYLFGIDKLLRSQVQLTTGVEYLITVKISRTKCKRNSTKNRSCPLQTKKNLKKSFICDFLVYTLPWMNHYQLWNNSCLDV
ncbi:cystatin-like 1 [Oryx dammah]|uniref:cystatin-like 1 n=1 Tax=Oryx dammah TaxID=59534 RepID=UPI001A9BE601|nr:cystatin-like 1 [Oryx dammah]